jgi:hypothetical protein
MTNDLMSPALILIFFHVHDLMTLSGRTTTAITVISTASPRAIFLLAVILPVISGSLPTVLSAGTI